MRSPDGPREAGVSDHPAVDVRRRVLGAWGDFLRLAAAVDLAAPTRLPGWRAHEVCVHLGSWPQHAALTSMAAAARRGDPPGAPNDPDAGNAAVVAAHRDAAPTEVLAALRRGRDAAAAYFASPDLDVIGRHPIGTPVGALPATSAIHTICYELAVHGLDLASAGGPPPPPRLLDAGLAALIDVTGSLAAAGGVHLTVAALDGGTGWGFTAGDNGWRTQRVLPETPPSPGPHTAVRARAAELLDVSAGRANAAALIASRRLHVDDLSAFLRLAPLVDSVPNLPGGAALRGTARVLRSAGGLLERLGLHR